jgi:hypothetical protein
MILYEYIPKEEHRFYCVQILIAEAEQISDELLKSSGELMKRVMRSSDFMNESIITTHVSRYISREINFKVREDDFSNV